MAQEIQTVSLFAPAFKGVNTESSPVQMDPSFAVRANNCVIDNEGRLGARKGLGSYSGLHSPSVTAGAPITMLHTHDVQASFPSAINFCAIDGQFRKYGTSSITDITPASYTISNGYWCPVQLGTKSYFFARGQEPLVFDEAVSFSAVNTFTTAGGTGFKEADVACAAFGRIWKGAIDGDESTLYYSDLLNGLDYTTGSSGSIDLTTVWPNGVDDISGIVSHNNFLIIFGKRSTLVYQGAEDPATMSLADTIPNIGCVARDSIQVIGTDVLFLSDQGVRSLGRTIQEKSVAIGTISANVKSDVVQNIRVQKDLDMNAIKSAYVGEDNFYLLSFPDQDIVYCFDVRTRLENGAMPVTTWGPIKHTAYSTGVRVVQDRSPLRIGAFNNSDQCLVWTYDGYSDPAPLGAQNYYMEYEAPILVFGDAQRTKFLKKVGLVVSGELGTSFTLKWGYGYGDSYKSKTRTVTIESATGAKFGEGEFGLEEFNPAEGSQTVSFNVNANGSGQAIRLGLSAEVQFGNSGFIQGSNIGIQSINLQTLLGKYI